MPLSIAAVVPNWNQAALTCRCVQTVRREVDHVYIVDNGSEAGDRALLDKAAGDDVTVQSNLVNEGYAAGCNRGMQAAVDAGFASVLVMNNDAFPDGGAVQTMATRLTEAPEVAAVGPLVVQYGSGEVLHVSCRVNACTGRTSWLQRGVQLHEIPSEPIRTGYLSGEAMLIRADALQDIDLFDDRYFCYYEDVDWSVRARKAGWKLEVVPTAVFAHVLSASSAGRVGTYYRARNQPLFLRVTLGRSRLVAFGLASPAELLSFASLLRRGEVSQALGGVLKGWVVGAAMRY